MTMRGWSFKNTKSTHYAVVVIMLLLSTFILPPLVGSGDIESPIIFEDDPPPFIFEEAGLYDYGINPSEGWNDTTFSFWINVSYPYWWNETNLMNLSAEIINVTIDSQNYTMQENNSRDWNYSDNKSFYWSNENRLWSAGTIDYYFYVNINGSENQTSTDTFTIYNREPYMLEPPFGHIEINEEFEWEGRATDEDLDPLNWTLKTNMAVNDYSEFELEENNTSCKIKIKCSQDFVRWFNLTVFDYLDNEEYWNWTVYCGAGGGTNYYWTGNGDAYQWDDYQNWVIEIAGVYTPTFSGEYPKDNGDQAFINETSDYIFVKDGANSVLTIGQLETNTGFSGTLNLSVDMVFDNAGGHDGNLTVNVGTYDVNGSADNQNNLDGNLTIDSSATLIEHEGIFIVQGAQTQKIRVQSTNALYKLTVDTSGTTGELFDNLTAYQITIGTGTTYKADANTRGYELWTNFSDIAGCGFVATSAGTLNLIGTYGGRQANITTADGTPPPTNHWRGGNNPYSVDISNATLSYFAYFDASGASVSIVNTTFYNPGNYATIGRTVPTVFRDNIADGEFLSVAGNDVTNIENLTVQNTPTYDLAVNNVRAELVDSNFDTSRIWYINANPSVISDNHNDVAYAYKIAIKPATSLSKSTITNDFTTGDNIELVSGKFIMDEDGQAKSIKINSGTTWQVGEDSPTASITLTFDDSSGAGFDDLSEGMLNLSGTPTYEMYITSENTPPTNYWTGGTVWASAKLLVSDYATLSYYFRFTIRVRGGIDFDVQNTTFDNGYGYIFLYLTGGTDTRNFRNNEISNSFGGSYIIGIGGAEKSNLENLVIGSNSATYDIWTNNRRLEFTDSNFDASKVDLGTTGDMVSLHHNDNANDYYIWATDFLKSAITNSYDSSDNVEIVSGTFIIDEASASNNFTINSDAELKINSEYTHTMTADSNMTNSGLLNMTGANLTANSDFDLYNPGVIWLNDSNITNADIVLPFGYNIGGSTNSTLNYYTIEPQAGQSMFVNITSETYENKDTGVAFHTNVSLNCVSCFVNDEEFTFGNLTAGNDYEVYISDVLKDTYTANSTGWISFKNLMSNSPSHIYIQGTEGGWTGGMNISWIIPTYPGITIWGILARFTWTISGNTVHLKDWSLAPTRPIINRTWTFDDGTEAYEENVSKSFSFGLITQTKITLTVCNDRGHCDTTSTTLTIINWFYWGILVALAMLIIGVVYYMEKKEAKK